MATSAPKIAVQSLDAKAIADLKKNYPHASLSVEFDQDVPVEALTEPEFWTLLNLLDWGAILKTVPCGQVGFGIFGK